MAVAEKIAPLLVNDEVDNLNKESKPETAPETVSADQCIPGFVYQRSTYYWIALMAQFTQLVLSTVGAAITNIHYGVALFIASLLYSLFSFYAVLALALPPKFNFKRPLNAGTHVSVAGYCAFLNICTMNIVMNLSGTDLHPLPVGVAVIFGSMCVSALACITAACITYRAAKRARGSEMVPDPEYRVRAWQLATAEESLGLLRQNAIQLPC